ncbi:MAG: prepilin-type N-terminal cleavage/methylation domain-containing protein [Eubacterium sp.]|nr:prepilin-type N-terminal cleavage/methylation domain-containing protein [Eubacterium sp.]
MALKNSNKGYSLVELIIVIAIIALISAMSMLTISVIHSAKAKDAAIRVDSEVGEIIASSRGKAYDSTDLSKYYALKIYKANNTFYIMRGYAQTDPADTSKYIFYDDGKNVIAEGYSLSPYVDIDWSKAVKKDELSNGILIVYSKSGQCLAGYGEYIFKKKNGSVVATDYIRQNGTHASK